jgi:uncharacterized protein (TIGR04255 family)
METARRSIAHGVLWRAFPWDRAAPAGATCARRIAGVFILMGYILHYVPEADCLNLCVVRVMHADESSSLPNAPTTVEVFPNAPVVEAILWLEFPPLDNLEDTLPLLAKDLGEGFLPPEERAVRVPATRKLRSVNASRAGYVFESRDREHLLRVERTSFSYHRLRPYRDWSDLASGARRAWAIFVRRYEPEVVSSMGLRYLNHFKLPPHEDLARYLVLLPNVPRNIDTGCEEYLLRLVLQDNSVPAVAEVTQLSNSRDRQGVTFDIEVSSESREYPPGEDSLWGQIDRLREYKNKLFFSSITEECRKLFR